MEDIFQGFLGRNQQVLQSPEPVPPLPQRNVRTLEQVLNERKAARSDDKKQPGGDAYRHLQQRVLWDSGAGAFVAPESSSVAKTPCREILVDGFDGHCISRQTIEDDEVIHGREPIASMGRSIILGGRSIFWNKDRCISAVLPQSVITEIGEKFESGEHIIEPSIEGYTPMVSTQEYFKLREECGMTPCAIFPVRPIVFDDGIGDVDFSKLSVPEDDGSGEPLVVVLRGDYNEEQEAHVLCGHAQYRKDCRGCRFSRATQAPAKRGRSTRLKYVDKHERAYSLDLRGPYETSHRGNGRMLCVVRFDLLNCSNEIFLERLNSASSRIEREMARFGADVQAQADILLGCISAGMDGDELHTHAFDLTNDESFADWFVHLIVQLQRRDELYAVPLPRKDAASLKWAISSFLFELSDSANDNQSNFVIHCDGESAIMKDEGLLDFVADRGGRYHKTLPGRSCAQAENAVRRISEIGIAALEESCLDPRHYDTVIETAVVFRNEKIGKKRRLNQAPIVKIGVLGHVNLPLKMFERLKASSRTVNAVFVGFDLITSYGCRIEFFDTALGRLRNTTVHSDSCRWSSEYAYGLQRQGLRMLRVAQTDWAQVRQPLYTEDVENLVWIICEVCGKDRRLPAFMDPGDLPDDFQCSHLDGYTCFTPLEPPGADELLDGEFQVDDIVRYDKDSHLYLVRWSGGAESWEPFSCLGPSNLSSMARARREAAELEALGINKSSFVEEILPVGVSGRDCGRCLWQESLPETLARHQRDSSADNIEVGNVFVGCAQNEHAILNLSGDGRVTLVNSSVAPAIENMADNFCLFSSSDLNASSLFALFGISRKDVAESVKICVSKTVSKAVALSEYGFLDWEEAYRAEVRNMNSFGSFSRPYKNRANVLKAVNGEKVTFSKIITVRAVKNADLSREEMKAKVRAVIFGCRITDEVGAQAVFERHYALPASMLETRVFFFICMMKSFLVRQFDVEGAYLHAQLPVRCFVTIADPEFERALLEHFGLSSDHVGQYYEALKAIYGHPLAGFSWADFLHEFFVSDGYTQDRDISCAMYFKFANQKDGSQGSLVSVAVIFADDGNVGGSSKYLRAFEIRFNKAMRAKISELSRFLGGDYKYILDSSGTDDAMHRCELSLSKYSQHLVENYVNDSTSRGMKPFSKRVVSTPSVDIQEDNDSPGLLEESCRSHVGAALFSARLGYPAELYAVSRCARRVSKWSRTDDDMLHRLMHFFSDHANDVLVMYVSPRDAKLNTWQLYIFTDADMGGDFRDRRSTSSVFILVLGEHGTCALLDFSSSVQKVTSCSTAESEVSAAHHGGKIGLGVIMILEFAFGKAIPVRMMVDSTCAMSIVKAGYSSSLRYIKKTHAISVQWLHELFSEFIGYVPSELNPSDLGTKPLSGDVFLRLRKFIGMRTNSLQRCFCKCRCQWFGDEPIFVRCLSPVSTAGSRFCDKCCAKGQCSCACWSAGVDEHRSIT